MNAQQVYEQRIGAKRMSEWLLYRMTRADMQRLLETGMAEERPTYGLEYCAMTSVPFGIGWGMKNLPR